MVSNASRLYLVDDSELHQVGARASFPQYILRLFELRSFIYLDARTRAFSSGQGTFLGKLWLILTPIFQVSVYALVFGAILRTSRGIDNFVGFLALGVILFGFISRSLNSSAGLVRRSRGFAATFGFPKASLILSLSVRQSLDNLVPFIVSILFALALQPSKAPGVALLLCIPLYGLTVLFNLGLSFIVARATHTIPDLKSIISIGTRGLFFFSGVFYSIEKFQTHPLLEQLVLLNPIYQFLSAIRSCVLEATSPSAETWLYLSTWSVALLLFGFLFFWQAEERYAAD